MNCKPGDLAVIVSARYSTNIGALVEVLRPYVEGEILPGQIASYYTIGPTWVVKAVSRPIFVGIDKHQQIAARADSTLRPIRDNPGQDETLDWAPIKEKSHV
jgi:hypothetical protein